MSITIDDIAAKCGLSRSTVSRVLRSSPNVSEKSRQLVQKVIEESGYRPNQVAQSLRRGIPIPSPLSSATFPALLRSRSSRKSNASFMSGIS